jgi:hypothetical protein
MGRGQMDPEWGHANEQLLPQCDQSLEILLNLEKGSVAILDPNFVVISGKTMSDR